jgi:hypothetical protein
VEPDTDIQPEVPVDIVLGRQLPQTEDEVGQVEDVSLRLRDRVLDRVPAGLAERQVLRQVIPTALPPEPPACLAEIAVLLQAHMELDARLLTPRTELPEPAIVALDQTSAKQLEVALRVAFELGEPVPRQRDCSVLAAVRRLALRLVAARLALVCPVVGRVDLDFRPTVDEDLEKALHVGLVGADLKLVSADFDAVLVAEVVDVGAAEVV